MLPAEIDLQTKRFAAANVRQMARECTSANEFTRLLEIATRLEVEAGALAHRTDFSGISQAPPPTPLDPLSHANGQEFVDYFDAADHDFLWRGAFNTADDGIAAGHIHRANPVAAELYSDNAVAAVDARLSGLFQLLIRAHCP
jgi:hypothetical protein